MKTTLTFILSIVSAVAFSQPAIEWRKIFHHIAPLDTATQAVDMDIDVFGNVFITGSSTNLDSMFEVITIKYDSLGNQLWLRKYQDSTNSFYAIPKKIRIDKDGNCYVFGQNIIGWSDIFLLKYDSSGNLIWNTIYSYPGANTDDDAMDMVLDDSVNIYTSGQLRYRGFETLKFDSAGNILWARMDSLNVDAGSTPYGNSVATDDSGNVFVAGRKFFNGLNRTSLIKYDAVGNKKWEQYLTGGGEGVKVLIRQYHIYLLASFADMGGWGNYVVAKFDEGGNQAWYSSYNGSYPRPKDFAVSDSENIYVVGDHFWGSCPIDKSTVVKFDSSGSIKWSRDYTSNDCNWDYGTSIYLDSLENVYVTGESGAGTFGIPEVMFCLSYDWNGNQLWVTRDIDTTLHLYTMGLRILGDKSGNLYVFSFESDTAGFGMMTIKYGLSSVSVPDVYFSNSEIQISPNPASTSFAIHASSPLKNSQLEIFNLLSEKVYSTILTSNEQTINIETLPAGIYFVSMQTEQGRAVQKLVKQ